MAMCIKFVLLDLDGTLWNCMDISSLEPPFVPISRNTIVDARGRTVKLFEGVREFLEKLRELDLRVVALSWNVKEIAVLALRAFDIDRYFDDFVIEPHPFKGYMMRKYFAERGISVDPNEILYIDDRDVHLQDIEKNVGRVRFVQMWRDVKSFEELTDLVMQLVSSCREAGS